jgi:hypothetical protein
LLDLNRNQSIPIHFQISICLGNQVFPTFHLSNFSQYFNYKNLDLIILFEPSIPFAFKFTQLFSHFFPQTNF